MVIGHCKVEDGSDAVLWGIEVAMADGTKEVRAKIEERGGF